MTCPTIDRLIISQKKLRRGIFVNVDNFIGTLAKENENGLRKFIPQQVFYPVTWTCQENTRKLTEHGCCKSQVIVYTAISWKEIPSDRYGNRVWDLLISSSDALPLAVREWRVFELKFIGLHSAY